MRRKVLNWSEFALLLERLSASTESSVHILDRIAVFDPMAYVGSLCDLLNVECKLHRHQWPQKCRLRLSNSFLQTRRNSDFHIRKQVPNKERMELRQSKSSL